MSQARFLNCDLGLLTASGDKAAQLLHGQFTNSIRDLNVGQGNYNLLLTTKGKVLADLHVVRRETNFLLMIKKTFFPLIQNHLQKLAPLSRVLLADESDHWQAAHVIGETSALPTLAVGHFAAAEAVAPGAWVYRSDRFGESGLDLVVPHSFDLPGWLKQRGIIPMSKAEAEFVRIKNGVACIGVDVTESNLPQEGRLERALHFDKGCYLGQEIIARLHFKGHVNKILTRLHVKTQGIKLGAEIWADGVPIGQVTSVAVNTAGDEVVALGYVSIRHAVPGTQLMVDGTPLIVSN